MEETRRGRKHPREETTEDGGGAAGGGGGGGYYADPMSPIASTPMKRPRTKPANTKSAKGKQAAVASPALTAAQKEEEKKFFSPRKLAKEYDDVDDDVDEIENGDEKKPKKRKLDTLENADANKEKKKPAMEKSDDVKASNGREEQGDDLAAISANGTTETVMFSPVLKVPRGTRSPSGGNSPVRETHARLDSAFASAASSNTTTPEKQDKEESVGVHCEESSIASEEAEASSEVSSDNEFNPFVFMKSLPNYDDLVPNGRATVLPAKTKHSPDVCLVLDLDETLVHCTVDHVENAHLQFPVNFNGVDYTVNVKKRPHMEYFLKQVSKRFEVVVFTASHRAYAEKLLNLIDPHRELIKYRLYREDCLDVYGNYLKDLTVLGRHLSKVVLVDNSPHAFGYQVNNGIPIETWYDDEKDDELLNLLPFLESLLETDDVRPVVEKQFQIQKLIDSLPDEFN